MAKQKITRKELLKSPDEFLTFTERSINFVRDRAKYFQIAGMVLVGAGLVYLGATAYLNYVNKKGQSAYYEAYLKLRGEKADPGKAEALFSKVAEDYRFSRVSKLVTPQIGHLKYQEKKHDEAAPLYETFMKSFPQKSPYRTLARFALAGVYEEKGDHQKAIGILNELTSSPENVFMEQSLLSLARLYRASGQNEEAVKIYKDFVDRFKVSPYLSQVKAYLHQHS